MTENSSASYLAHYGTPRMKWGVRKYQNKDGSLTPAGRLRYGKGESTKSSKADNKKPKKKSLSEMSDDELKDQINRFKLEKEYKQLVSEINPKKENKARKMISEMASASLKNIGTQAMTFAMGAAVNKIAKKAFDLKDDVVNPKKGQKDK